MVKVSVPLFLQSLTVAPNPRSFVTTVVLVPCPSVVRTVSCGKYFDDYTPPDVFLWTLGCHYGETPVRHHRSLSPVSRFVSESETEWAWALEVHSCRSREWRSPRPSPSRPTGWKPRVLPNDFPPVVPTTYTTETG